MPVHLLDQCQMLQIVSVRQRVCCGACFIAHNALTRDWQELRRNTIIWWSHLKQHCSVQFWPEVTWPHEISARLAREVLQGGGHSYYWWKWCPFSLSRDIDVTDRTWWRGSFAYLPETVINDNRKLSRTVIWTVRLIWFCISFENI